MAISRVQKYLSGCEISRKSLGNSTERATFAKFRLRNLKEQSAYKVYPRISEEKGLFLAFSGLPRCSLEPPEKGESGAMGLESKPYWVRISDSVSTIQSHAIPVGIFSVLRTLGEGKLRFGSLIQKLIFRDATLRSDTKLLLTKK